MLCRYWSRLTDVWLNVTVVSRGGRKISELSLYLDVRWRWVCLRNTRILLFSYSSHTYTTLTFRKIIFHEVWKGWRELQGRSQASLHRSAVRDVHFVWCYTWSVQTRPSVFSLQMLCLPQTQHLSIILFSNPNIVSLYWTCFSALWSSFITVQLYNLS